MIEFIEGCEVTVVVSQDLSFNGDTKLQGSEFNAIYKGWYNNRIVVEAQFGDKVCMQAFRFIDVYIKKDSDDE